LILLRGKFNLPNKVPKQFFLTTRLLNRAFFII